MFGRDRTPEASSGESSDPYIVQAAKAVDKVIQAGKPTEAPRRIHNLLSYEEHKAEQDRERIWERYMELAMQFVDLDYARDSGEMARTRLIEEEAELNRINDALK